MIDIAAILYLTPPLVQTLLSIILITLILKKSERNIVHYLFSLYLAALALWGVAVFGLRASPDTSYAYNWERALVAISPLYSAVLYHFSVKYRGTAFSKKFIYAIYLVSFLCIPLALTNLVVAGMQIKPYGYAPIFGSLFSVWILFNYSLFVLAIVNFIKKWRNSQYAEERNRAAYIVIGIFASLIGATFDILPALGLPLYPGLIIGNIAFCTLTSIAIAKYQLLDIKVVLRTSIVYILTSAIISAPFVFLFILVNYVFTISTVPLWGYFMIMIVLALLWQPIWGRTQRQVDHWFYRDRYNYLKALENLSHDTQNISNYEILAVSAVDLISSVLKCKNLLILQKLPPDNNFHLVVSNNSEIPLDTSLFSENSLIINHLNKSRDILSMYEMELIPQLQGLPSTERKLLRDVEASLILPLLNLDGEISGVVIAGRKISGQQYSVEEKQILKAMCGQIATALENARLYAESIKIGKALQESENNYRLIIENQTDLLVKLDTEGQILFTSPSFREFFGVAEEAVLGQKFITFVYENDREDAIATTTKNLYSHPYTCYLEQRAYGQKGLSWLAWGWKSVLNENNEVIGLVGVGRDITERKKSDEREVKLQEELYRSAKLATIGQMVAGIAHEINNPLTGVIGFSQLIMDKDNAPEDIKRDLSIIYSGAQRVSGIVNRLLTFSRQQKLQRIYLDINQIIKETIDLRSYSLKNNNIDVKLDLDSILPQTMADRGQLQQVFLNMILNAETEMKNVHGQGQLTIKTKMRNDKIHIKFKDDGPGISKENKDRIFDPFFTTHETGKGTGLGLSICYGIVAEHNGKIYVESELGKGAQFTLELPVVGNQENIQKKEISNTARKFTKLNILLIDDEILVQKFLSRLFIDMGFQVQATDNAMQAIDIIKNNQFDLIFLDIKMPEINGIQFFEYLRTKQPEYVNRIIFITGDVSSIETQQFLIETKVPYITKPIIINELKRIISEMTD